MGAGVRQRSICGPIAREKGTDPRKTRRSDRARTIHRQLQGEEKVG